MSILTDVDRRSTRTKFALGVVYTLLTIGAVTMVYPFLLMIMTGMTNKVDYEHYRPVPHYLYDDDALYLKFTHTKTVNEWNGIRRPYLIWQSLPDENYNLDWTDVDHFPHLHEGEQGYFDRKDPGVRQRVDDWYAFKLTLPEYMTHLNFWTDRNNRRSAEKYQKWLKRKYKTIETLNEIYGTAYSAFNELDTRSIKVAIPVYRFAMPYKGSRRPHVDHDGPHYKDWMQWREEEVTPFDIGVCLVDVWYQYNLLGLASNFDRYNELCGTSYGSLNDVHMPERAPDNPVEREFWEEIVRYKTSWVFIEIRNSRNVFQQYLSEKYRSVERYNERHDTVFATFAEIEFPTRFPESDSRWRMDWGEMLKRAPVDKLRVDRPESLYTRFLEGKYGSLAELNAAQGSSWQSFSEIAPPLREQDTIELFDRKWRWRLFFMYENYVLAVRFMASQGRAIINTTILVMLHVLIQLTVNPLAAYALSRYRPRYGNKMLMFFIATMAFPPTVGMIPQFLMLKQFGLLNTYWAILLPMSAQGYYIFLLKGFFDSLPVELFEAAKIDGASELRMFFQIAVPVCKPIFAVIALRAFRVMYGAFMFALLVCQEPAKWTIMVFIYQFRQMPFIQEYHVMAVLTITALPTLILFLKAQKIIIRGIVIPQMK